MKVIPVIDILNGIVVHAVKGKRREYQPLQSNLTRSVEPLEVAKTFKMLGFSEIYIADLDAITKHNMNFKVFKNIADETSLKLIVDAGVSDIERAEKMFDCGVSKVVIGTETLKNKNFVNEAIKVFKSSRIIVSLDLKGEKVLVKLGFAGCVNPMCLLSEFNEMGVSNVIVLDLARVGSEEGVNVDFLKKVLKHHFFDVYVGGGVRNTEDLLEIKKLGVSGVLVATTLHSGKIAIEDLKHVGLI